MSSPFIDNLIALRVLHMLVTPFVDTDAYKLGIIDEKGVPLKKASQLHSTVEFEAYTLLHRLVFRLKRIIERVPLENKKFLSYAAALALIREYYESESTPLVTQFEMRLINEDVELTTNEIEFVENFFSKKYVMPFKLFDEFGGGMGPAGPTNGGPGGESLPAGAPANNINITKGIAVPNPPPLFGKGLIRRKNKNGLTK